MNETQYQMRVAVEQTLADAFKAAAERDERTMHSALRYAMRLYIAAMETSPV